MKSPCEHAIWYILPQIRADLAKELVKKNMRQKEIAEKLSITPSAVSQYLHKKRGEKMKMPAKYRKRIMEIAEEIKNAASDKKISKLICQCCMESRSKTN